MNRQHIIEQAIFDISFGSDEEAFENQSDLGILVKTRLMHVVDQVFDEMSSGEGVFRVNSLEVDLGDVAYLGYQEELEVRLADRLRAALREKLASIRVQPGSHEVVLTRAQSELEQLEYFLLNGRLPWHADQGPGNTVDQLLRRVIQSNSPGLVGFLRISPGRLTAISRLVSQFPDEILAEIAGLLCPVNVSFPASLVDDFRTLWRKYRFSEATEREFRTFIWEQLIDELLESHLTSINPGDLFKGILKRITLRSGSYGTGLLAALANEAAQPETRDGLGLELTRLFRTVPRENDVRWKSEYANPEIASPQLADVTTHQGQEAGVPTSTAEESPSTSIELLRHRLADAMSSSDAEKLRNVWPTLLRYQPELLIEAFRFYGRQVKVRRMIASGLPESMLRDLVDLLEPAEATFIKETMGKTSWFAQAIGQPRMPTAILNKRLWEFTLAYLLNESDRRFNKNSYIRSLVQQIATYSHIEYQGLIRSLARLLEHARSSNTTPSELLSIVGSLVAEEDSSQSTPKESGSESRDLIQSYELYERLRQRLLGDVLNGEAEATLDLIQIVDQLARAYPWQMMRLYRELQVGGLSGLTELGISDSLSASELSHLIQALLTITQQAEAGKASDLMGAIQRYAGQAQDGQGYYRRVLECLIQNQNIDFEAIIESDQSVSEAAGREPATREPATREEAPPGSLPTEGMPPMIGDESDETSEARLSYLNDQNIDPGVIVESDQSIPRIVGQEPATVEEAPPGSLPTEGMPPPIDDESAEVRLGYLNHQNIDSVVIVESAQSISKAEGREPATVEEAPPGSLPPEGMRPPIDDEATEVLFGYLGYESVNESGSESRDLIQSYELYERLRQRLLGGASSGEGEAAGDLIQIIDQLTRAYPWQMMRLYRELQAGGLTKAGISDRLSASELSHLIQALLTITQQAEAGNASDLKGAIERYAGQAQDGRGYYRRVLECLIQNQNIDFEAIIESDQSVSEAVARELDIGEEASPGGLPTEGVPPMIGDESDETSEARLSYLNDQNIDPGVIVESDQSIPQVVGQELATVEEAQTSSLPTEGIPPPIDDQALLSYLKEGGILSAEDTIRLIRILELLLSQQPGRLRQLLEPVLEVREAAGRISQLMPERLLTRVIFLLRPSEHPWAQRSADIIADACQGLGLSLETARVRQLKWQFIFRHLLEEGLPYEEGSFVRGFAGYLAAETAQMDAGAFQGRLSQQINRDALPATRERHAAIVRALTGERESAAAHETRPAPASPLARSINVEPDITEDIYIANAGQVLAAPYLSRLFAMLDLTDASAFKDRHAAERAVHLLQFMINESSNSPEYQLVLNKILCGVRVGLPIEREIEITEREKEVVEGLIQGMIQNWKAIGNTSVTGFRESFLQRGGRLWLQNDAWHLQVEPRAFDMLLDSIPWSFSTIKFPWMERVIYVEWR